MKKLRIYTDTSVIGGCLDDEFEEASLRLFECFRSGLFTIVISDLTEIELLGAPTEVRKILDDLPESAKETLEFTAECKELADRYISEGVIVESKRMDAQHIATATVHKADVLVSWNFRHIVNLGRIHGYNAVNMKLGYPVLDIRSPWETLIYEED
ncbi:MAG: PIN domain protein [Planctomycetes bacterium]|nr:PIN domain protein [Planctomycetota bacterium]